MAMGLRDSPDPTPGMQPDQEPRHLTAGGDTFLMEHTLSGEEFHISLLLREKLYLGRFHAGVVFGD